MTWFKTTIFVFIFLVFAENSFAEFQTCTTPNGEIAKCISLYNCDLFLNSLATRDTNIIEFIRKSGCGCQHDPLVCCGTSANFTTGRQGKLSVLDDKLNLLTDKKFCGYQHTDDRVYSGYTAIDEFPWMALISYRKRNGSLRFLCSGTIISSRYVLTAAHCITNLDVDSEIAGVRLGEYRIDTKIDCVNDTGIEDCSEPVIDLAVEKIISHPSFSKRNLTNDIGLLRLSERVYFSDFVRPICLPLSTYDRVSMGSTLTSSGWGSNALGTPSNLKKRIKMNVITNEECQLTYKARTQIKSTHLCTITTGEDFGCSGDSGGPVMSPTNNQWYLYGIMSFGPRVCNTSADVHTRVSEYLDWILQNISP